MENLKKKTVTLFIAIFTLLRYSGTEPTISLMFASILTIAIHQTLSA